MANIARSIKEAAMRGERIYNLICTVDSVDEAGRCVDCTPVDGSAPLVEVRLQSAIKGDGGLLIIPKKGSEILVGFLDRNNAAVLLCSEIEKITLEAEASITINGGENGGLVKVAKLTDRLNVIEKEINDLKTVFLGWTPVAQDGGAALKTAVGTWAGEQMQTTQKEDIENDKVTH
jgi:hypothetical protein